MSNGGNRVKPEAYVGPYWFVCDCDGNTVLLAHRCSVDVAEKYGDFLTCPHGHYEVWEEWRSAGRLPTGLADAEYEEWPRGRVVLDSLTRRFIVYADAQLFEPEYQQQLMRHFGIPAESVSFRTDEHYRSTLSVPAKFHTMLKTDS